MRESDLCTFEVTSGEDRCKVILTVLLTGDGLAVFIHGGERQHIGASVVSIPIFQESSEDCRWKSCSYICPRPSHKDHVIAQIVSEAICEETGTVVFAIAGFHLDDITKEEIASVINNSNTAALTCVNILKHEHSECIGEWS